MKKNVCIIGDGGWGTALAMLLAENDRNVTVWGPFPKYIDTVRKSRTNKSFLPGVKLPATIKWTADRHTAVSKANLVVFAVPTKYFRDVAESFAGLIPKSCGIMSVSKGFDKKNGMLMTQVLHEVYPAHITAALFGPSHAEEVARRIPTAVTVASGSSKFRCELQQLLSNKYFRVYTSSDVVGIELGGALKNVIAIAVGASDGLGFGDNTRAALITRGLAEITRLGCALGARPSTFAGLSGMGDLIVTCTSRLSRNHNVGERLGKGEKIQTILASMKQVAEGVWNCAIARNLARKTGIEAPITEEIYQVIHNGKNPLAAVKSLMSRDVKAE